MHAQQTRQQLRPTPEQGSLPSRLLQKPHRAPCTELLSLVQYYSNVEAHLMAQQTHSGSCYWIVGFRQWDTGPIKIHMGSRH